FQDGSYFEYKITDEYVMVLTDKGIRLFQNNILNKTLVVSEFKDGTELLINNDTLVTISKSKDKVVLRSTYTFDKYEFNKAEFKIDEIDSINLESWKNKTLSEFRKRAELRNCPDLRTDDEKELDAPLEFDMEIEEEIPIKIIEK